MKNYLIYLLTLVITFSSGNQYFAQDIQQDQLIEDLSSPLQKVRSDAAIQLKGIYKSSPKSAYDQAMNKLKLGITKEQIFRVFEKFKIKETMSLGSGQSHSIMFQIDNDWMLNCWFDNAGDKLTSWILEPYTVSFWVEPIKNFNGKWITYFSNGEKSHEINYKNGKYDGEFISYHSDGSKSVVQHYDNKGCNGTDIGYYPSGKIKYAGEYKNGKQCGTWIHYDESGNITSSKEFDDC